MTPALLRCLLAVSLCAPFIAAAQATAPEPPATIHVDTNLVVIDVVVTDSHGNPVHHLMQGDFNLREDGHPQTLKIFEEHSADDLAKALPAPPAPLAPGVFSNDFALPATGPLNILLLDQLNTPEADQSKVREQLVQYLKEAPAGARFALLCLTAEQLSLLQGFTADHNLLLAALASNKAAPRFPVLLGANMPSSPTGPSGMNAANTAKMEARRQHTLDSLNQLTRYLRKLPGRKNLLWFSSSFPIQILSNGEAPENTQAGYVDEYRETVNLLAHNQVAIYPIDSRGLTTEPVFTGSNANTGGGGRANPVIPSQNDAYFTANANRRAAMEELASATGGQAFANSNSLKQAAARAVEGGSNYYTLGYTPTNDKWKGEYRKIQIEFAHKGMTLYYRRGYYAADPNAPVQKKEAKEEAKNDSTAPAPFSPMKAAMVHGAPEASQIVFEAHVRPSIAGEEPAVYPHNQPTANATGPFRRYNVHLKAHLDDIHCDPTPQGPLYCAVEFVTCVYNADGALINAQVNDIKENVKPEYFAAVHKPGSHPEFQYKQEISVPVKGEYYLRVGVHDLLTDHVGAVELPVSAVSNLPPLTAASPATAPAPK